MTAPCQHFGTGKHSHKVIACIGDRCAVYWFGQGHLEYVDVCVQIPVLEVLPGLLVLGE